MTLKMTKDEDFTIIRLQACITRSNIANHCLSGVDIKRVYVHDYQEWT